HRSRTSRTELTCHRGIVRWDREAVILDGKFLVVGRSDDGRALRDYLRLCRGRAPRHRMTSVGNVEGLFWTFRCGLASDMARVPTLVICHEILSEALQESLCGLLPSG